MKYLKRLIHISLGIFVFILGLIIDGSVYCLLGLVVSFMYVIGDEIDEDKD